MGKITGYSYYPLFFQDSKTGEKRVIYYPLIQIRVSIDYGRISYPFDALIDSGSDRNLFPLYFARYLEITFKGKPKKIYGIGDNFIEAYTAKINLWLGEREYKTEADFSPQQKAPILGEMDFLIYLSPLNLMKKASLFILRNKI